MSKALTALTGSMRQSFITHRSAWAILICIAVLSIMLFALTAYFPEFGETLLLNADALDKAEYWRLLFAHFTHSNLWHLLLNLGGMLLTWILFIGVFSASRLLLVLCMCTLGLSFCLLFFGETQNYLGLSGTLHGIFAFALTLELRQKRLSTYVLAIIGIIKLLYEQLGGSTQDTAELIGLSVAIDGHLYGAVLGVVSALMVLLFAPFSRGVSKRTV